jgi:hypothetical protein
MAVVELVDQLHEAQRGSSLLPSKRGTCDISTVWKSRASSM